MKPEISEVLKKTKNSILQLIYPRVCPLCGRILAHDESRENPYICKDCYPQLHFPGGARCLKCSRPLPEEGEEFCPDCRRDARWFDQGISLLIHDDAAKKILYDLKYSNKRDHADMLAHEAASRFAHLIRHWKPEVILPIPLYPKKEIQRGFNQAAVLSERFSGFLKEKGVVLPVDTEVLKRTRKTTVQKELNKYQRMANIRGAFEVKPPESKRAQEETQSLAEHPKKNGILPYSRILLIDDIYTSGATISEAARVLKEAGADQVFFLTFSIG